MKRETIIAWIIIIAVVVLVFAVVYHEVVATNELCGAGGCNFT